VKAHNDNYGNGLADQLAKEAASNDEVETAYNKIPKIAVVRELKEEGELMWQSEWDASTKGEITKSFFPIIKDRISKSLHMGIKPIIDNNRTRYTEITLSLILDYR